MKCERRIRRYLQGGASDFVIWHRVSRNRGQEIHGHRKVGRRSTSETITKFHQQQTHLTIQSPAECKKHPSIYKKNFKILRKHIHQLHILNTIQCTNIYRRWSASSDEVRVPSYSVAPSSALIQHTDMQVLMKCAYLATQWHPLKKLSSAVQWQRVSTLHSFS